MLGHLGILSVDLEELSLKPTFYFLNNSLTGVRRHLIMVYMCISVTVGECNLVSHWIQLCPSSVLISKGFLNKSSLCIMDIHPLSHVCFENIFACSVFYLFQAVSDV